MQAIFLLNSLLHLRVEIYGLLIIILKIGHPIEFNGGVSQANVHYQSWDET